MTYRVSYVVCVRGVLAFEQPDLVVNGAQYCVLEHVGRARAAGVLQNRLSKELGIDQRNLFHNLKHLKVRGIVRCQIVMLKEGKINVKTNLIHLSRFVKGEGMDEQAPSTLPVSLLCRFDCPSRNSPYTTCSHPVAVVVR
jgi:hypothetical protein